jgi:ribosomal protein L32
MADEPGAPAGEPATTAGETGQVPPPESLITCNQCGHSVPRLEFCVRCGDPLSDEYSASARREKRGRFRAAPDEPVRTVALISTLFPQLPRAEMRVFRLALLIGTAIIVGVTLLGFFPVALVAAAVLVPLLMVLYLWVVDIYEDAPLWVIGATMLWGAAAGIAAGLLLRLLPAGPSFGGPRLDSILLAGVAVPILEAALMLAGPLLLLSVRRFNDVLDGATFGAASAVSFTGVQLLVQSLPVLSSGLRPQSDPLPWVVQLISLGILQPVIAAGSIGAIAAAFWLRYRAPESDRNALGALGMPTMAVAAGLVLLVAAGLAKVLLPLVPATVVLAVLAAIALLWLRGALHLGLRQEASEIEITGSINCLNCGRVTPAHTFCGNCGISLRAVPRGQKRSEPPAAETAK